MTADLTDLKADVYRLENNLTLKLKTFKTKIKASNIWKNHIIISILIAFWVKI
jgi:hypothetical protein